MDRMQIDTGNDGLYRLCLELYKKYEVLEFLGITWRIENVLADHGNNEYTIKLIRKEPLVQSFKGD